VGNCNTSGPNNFTTDAAAETASSSIGGTTVGVIYPTLTDTQFNNGHSLSMFVKGSVGFKVGSEMHQVKIISVNVTSRTAVINVSSTPQQKTMIVGEEWKVNLNADNYYDVLVRLNNVSAGKVNITLTNINELVPVIAAATTNVTTTDEEISQNEPVSVWKYVLVWAVIIVIVLLIFWFAFLRGKLREKKIQKAIRYSSKNDK
jgi:hypothetical protein